MFIRVPRPPINAPTATTIAPTPEDTRAAVMALIPPVAKLAEAPTPFRAPDNPVAAVVPLPSDVEALELTDICTFLTSFAIIFV